MAKYTPEDIQKFVRALVQMPFAAINIHRDLFTVHKPGMSKEIWVKAQMEMVDQIGIEAYFYLMLENLEKPPNAEEIAAIPIEDFQKAISSIQRGKLSPYQNIM